MEALDVEKRRQAAGGRPGSGVARRCLERAAAAHDALAGVCFCSGRTRPCQGAANVASEMTSFYEPVADVGSSSRGHCRGR